MKLKKLVDGDGSPNRMNRQKVLDPTDFAAIELEFVELIAKLCNHPRKQVGCHMKSGENSTVILDFHIDTNSEKNDLQERMKDNASLIKMLNGAFKQHPKLANISVVELSMPFYSGI